MSNARLQRWTPLSRQRRDAEPGSRALDQRDKAIELFRTDMARLLAAVESVDAGCGPTFDEVCADAKAASEQLLARLRALTGEDWRTVPSLFAYRYRRATPYGGHAAEIVAANRSPLDAFGEYADGRGAAGG